MWHLKKKKKCNNSLCLNLHNFCYYFCYIYLGFQGEKITVISLKMIQKPMFQMAYTSSVQYCTFSY